MRWFSGKDHKNFKMGAHVLYICTVNIKKKEKGKVIWVSLKTAIDSFKENALHGNTAQCRSVREENGAVRGSGGGTGSVCRVVRLEPSHSVISMGDSLSLSLVVCRQPVNQSKKLRAELTTLLPPARRNTQRENWGNFWTAGEKYWRILFVLIFSLDLKTPDLSWCLRIFSPFRKPWIEGKVCVWVS